MARIFPVEIPRRYNQKTGTLEPWMDLTPALVYGSLEEPLLDDGKMLAMSPAPMIVKIRQRLMGFTKDDYLLLVGDTTAIAASVMVAFRQTNGYVQVLKWDKNTGSYLKSVLQV